MSIESLDKTKKHFRQSLLRGRRGTTAVVDEEDIMLSINFDLSILTTQKGISLFGKIPFVFSLRVPFFTELFSFTYCLSF